VAYSLIAADNGRQRLTPIVSALGDSPGAERIERLSA